MEHYVGRIFNFVQPPSKESVFIDIPFFEQDPVSDEILINIPKGDVKNDLKNRYNELYEIPTGLLEIIKRNGVSVRGQMNIYRQLEQDIHTTKYNNFAWSRMPEWDNILYILDLSENNLFQVDHNGIVSVRQLALYLNKYRTSKDIIDIINLIYENRKTKVQTLTARKNEGKYYDEAVEQAFHIHRHWFLFTVPKIFRVVDSLQRYVCENYSRRAGSYGYFIQQLENDFIPENLSILIEYGVPASAVRKLDSKVPRNLSEDEVVEYIRRYKRQLTSDWLQYERDKLDEHL